MPISPSLNTIIKLEIKYQEMEKKLNKVIKYLKNKNKEKIKTDKKFKKRIIKDNFGKEA